MSFIIRSKTVLYGNFLLFFLSVGFLKAQSDIVTVFKDDSGSKLQVNGKDFFIIGMNWDYFPTGTNYSYNLWAQPDDMIKEALRREMQLLKEMGVNTIRQYSGIPPKWVEYIYKNYGIFTVLNHSFGRYGLMVDGEYVVNTDYSEKKTKEILLNEIKELARKFKNTPGVLMWLIGNENNYGLFWKGAETEDIPTGETLESVRARHLYSLFSEAIDEIKNTDKNRPVAICNGDLLFIDIIAEEIRNMDVFGINVYRGVSFGDMFEKVKDKLDKPLLPTEFGADAYNALLNLEDQLMQAKYLMGNWREIFEQAYGKGKQGNSIGGMTFQFSDGWWKYMQDKNLDIHDNNASWSNGGYTEDFKPGLNNMNEEWFGICEKGPADEKGLYRLFPRAAYFALKEALNINPLDENVTNGVINNHFGRLDKEEYLTKAKEYKKSYSSSAESKIRSAE